MERHGNHDARGEASRGMKDKSKQSRPASEPAEPWVLHQQPISKVKAEDVFVLSTAVRHLAHTLSALFALARGAMRGDADVSADASAAGLVGQLVTGLDRLRSLDVRSILSLLNAFSRGPVEVGDYHLSSNAHDALITIAECCVWRWEHPDEDVTALRSEDTLAGGDESPRRLLALARRLSEERMLPEQTRLRYMEAMLEIERDSAFALRFRIVPPEVGDLSGEERLLLDALRRHGHPMTTEQLLRSISVNANDSNYKKILAGLVQRHWLTNRNKKGYALPEWTGT